LLVKEEGFCCRAAMKTWKARMATWRREGGREGGRKEGM